MTATDRAPVPLSLQRWLAVRRADLAQLTRWRPRGAETERYLPLAVGAAMAVGLVAVAMLTPIAGRGDYGQWLMTSRFYLGEPIPGYRDVTALPPFVPLLLVFIRILVPDPVIALEMLNGLLLAGLCATFYLLGATLLSNRWAGVLSMIVSFLITDRFLELFAFGGLLQAASLMFMGLSVVAFLRAASAPQIERRWWVAGVLAMALAVLSHVATGLIAVPVGVLAAGLAVMPRRDMGWRALGRTLLPLALGLLAVAAYWVVVLLPASTEYVTNPASLAYRGPDRLFSSLFAYWPTSVAVVLGAGAIGLGSLGELLQRRTSGYVVLLMWSAVTWGALAYSMVTAAATDYPRFATLLLTPLVVGAAGAVLWLITAMARYVDDLRPGTPQAAFGVAAVLLLTVVATPFAVQRYGRQSLVYQPRDAAALTAAAEWIDHALGGQPGTVLTDVRDGKWLEGITGREALFSLPVRYAFRPVEWQRTIDADTLLRSTMALTSGLVTAVYTDRRVVNGASIPSDLLLRVNHGGEFVDLLRLNWAAIQIRTNRDRWVAANQLAPVRAVESENPKEATVTTVWGESDRPISFVQRATVWKDGAALGVRLHSPRNGLRATLEPPAGAAWTVSDSTGQEATVCLAPVGGTPPCARIWVGSGAVLSATATGGMKVTSSDRSRIDLLVTALSAGKASVGLGLLDPESLVAERNVKAALLWRFDPAFGERVRRLAALGFHTAESIGPYQVLLRSDVAAAGGTDVGTP